MSILSRRMADERSNIRPTKSVCRRLFGNPDHEETRQWLHKEIETIHKQDREKWNFDFERDVPLQGKWAWQKIDSNSNNVPAAYATVGLLTNPLRSTPTTVSKSNGEQTDNSEPKTTSISKAKTKSSSAKQPPITDFMKVKKRKIDLASSTKAKRPRSSNQDNSQQCCQST